MLVSIKCYIKNVITTIFDQSHLQLPNNTISSGDTKKNKRILSSKHRPKNHKLEGLSKTDRLTEQEKQQISKARKFINKNTNWDFTEKMQFTIEPQLISTEDFSLPQISQHYLVKKLEGEFIVCKDIENILTEYNLIGE